MWNLVKGITKVQVNNVYHSAVINFLGYFLKQLNQVGETLAQNHAAYYDYYVNRKDVVKLEEVQKRFTRLPGLEGLSYKEVLNRLGLFSLEHQRLRCDLIEVYKIMRGMDR
eukprot:g42828.t1